MAGLSDALVTPAAVLRNRGKKRRLGIKINLFNANQSHLLCKSENYLKSKVTFLIKWGRRGMIIKADRFFISELLERGFNIDYEKLIGIYQSSRKRTDYLQYTEQLKTDKPYADKADK